MARRPGKPRSTKAKRKTQRDNQAIDADVEATDQADSSGKTFHDLPAELRNEIYELSFQDELIEFPDGKGRAKVPGVLMVSKQIHKEALPMFYSEAQFLFSSSARVLSWLKKIGSSKRKWLCKVDVDCSDNIMYSFCFNDMVFDHLQQLVFKICLERPMMSRHLALERCLADHGVGLKPGCITVTAICPEAEPCHVITCHREGGNAMTGSRSVTFERLKTSQDEKGGRYGGMISDGGEDE